jgi:hypothetical protein
MSLALFDDNNITYWEIDVYESETSELHRPRYGEEVSKASHREAFRECWPVRLLARRKKLCCRVG